MENYNKEFVFPKLKISEVITHTFILYRQNFKLFVQFTLISFLINLFTSTFDYMKNIVSDSTVLLVYSLISLILIIPSIYYDTKISIAFYICICERYKEKEIDFKKAYSKSSLKFWRYIGVVIQLFLIVLIPMASTIGVFFFVKDVFVKWVLTILFLIPSIYLGTIYGFAPLRALFENKQHAYFKLSKKLVVGDLWKIIFLTLITFIISSVPYYLYAHVFNDYYSIPQLEKYIMSRINHFVFIFVRPFTTTLYVILYYRLKINKKI